MTTVGWHPDPEDAARERWWDGVDWTAHTRPAPAPEGARRLVEREPVRHAPDDRTALLGWIAGSPFWAGSVLAILSLFGDWMPPAILLGLLVAVLCLFDGRALRRRGLPSPSPWWALLGALGHLVGRRRALGQRDAGLLWLVAGGSALVAVPVFIFTAVRLGIAAAGSGG